MRTRMKVYSALLGLIFVFSGVQDIKSQSVMIANTDNYFVEPSSLTRSYLDVLANDYYGDDCVKDMLQVSVTVAPTKGVAMFDASTRTIAYIPMPGRSGTDQFTYRIYCPDTGNSATGVAYININDKPDVISDADCYVDPEPLIWGIKELTRTQPVNDADPNHVSSVSNILTGDIDGDGKIEVLVFNADPALMQPSSPTDLRGPANKVLAFEYNGATNSLDLDYAIDLPNYQYIYPSGGIAIANVDNDGCASLFVVFQGATKNLEPSVDVGNDSPMLIKYKYKPGVGNTQENFVKGYFEEDWRVSFTDTTLYRSANPLIVDLMGDGNYQVCMLNKVFNASTGVLLIDGATMPVPITLSMNYSFGRYGHTGGQPLQSALIAADLDNDGVKELVGGDCIYKVSLSNYNGDTGNTLELWRRADFAGHSMASIPVDYISTNYDGGTALVDVDLDGELDVVVTGKLDNGVGAVPRYQGLLYVYNPRTGKPMHTNTIILGGYSTGVGPSMPFVGDIDGDGYPEIALTSYCILQAYKLNLLNSTLDLMWDLLTTDTSASTTLSIFDFAQSGISQLIYRDETDLRIIDGRKYNEDGDEILTGDPKNNDPNAGTRVLATFSNVGSVTINEYPIVADITGDGFAEILAVGRDAGGRNFCGQLRMYGPVSGQWAPARCVWNQIAYNPLYVNDDLTIPAEPLSVATKFIAASGAVNRPFNNFLQQATQLNREGTMITEAADLTFSPRAPRKISFNDDGSITISVVLVNIGSISFSGPIELQLYSSLDGSPVTYAKVGDPFVVANASGLAPNVDLPVTFTIPSAKVPADGTYDGFAITVNLTTDPGNASPEYKNSAECHEGYNNRALGFNVVDGSTIICEGSSGRVYANPADTYDINWYNTSGTLLASKVDSYVLPVKNSDQVTHLLVQAFKKGSSTPITTLLDTIYIYRAVDSLVWNNAEANGDWHDYRNWINPADVDDKYPQANIPLSCTSVYLPGAQSHYPDLGNKTSGGSTDYSAFSTASCNNIRFGFGGELKRPDLLAYAKAYVDVELETHRWYMFAPPLKNFYAGDFYLKDVIPSKDDIKSYTRLWASGHPYGGYYESSWTPLFFQPEVTFVKGQGIGVWISDKLDRDNVFHEFSFPKSDEEYYVYYDGTETINPYFPPQPLSRTLSNRFIFDSEGSSGADFTLSAEAKSAGSFVMVSNPFMSHLDFDKFYAKNSGKIKAEYKILNRNSNDYLYYKQGQPSTLTSQIAPMQAFLVEALVPFTELTVNGTMTSIVAGGTLRSGEEESRFTSFPITVSQDSYRSIAYIGFSDSYYGGYNADEDVISMFSVTASEMRPVSVYTVSEDNKKMNLNGLPVSYLENGGIIPLGIRTPSDKKIMINVGNLSMLPGGCKVYLYDSKTNLSHDLASRSMYTFDDIKTDADSFLDNRFFLKIVRNQTGIDTPDLSSDNKLSVSVRGGLLNIQSLYELEEIVVYNLQGQLLYVGTPRGLEWQTGLPETSFYIVRIKTEKGVEVRKVLNQR